jgi:hypothetical protein
VAGSCEKVIKFRVLQNTENFLSVELLAPQEELCFKEVAD